MNLPTQKVHKKTDAPNNIGQTVGQTVLESGNKTLDMAKEMQGQLYFRLSHRYAI